MSIDIEELKPRIKRHALSDQEADYVVAFIERSQRIEEAVQEACERMRNNMTRRGVVDDDTLIQVNLIKLFTAVLES